MGSEHFARNPTVDLDEIDMMVCMDLVGHALGPPEAPASVRNTVFALGAERSLGTREIVGDLSAPGVIVRPVDAEVIPPLSDYHAFWERERPFLLLTNARSRIYHTPEDVPALLDWDKMAATARWLEAFVRASCARDPQPVIFENRRHDASTLVGLRAILEALAPASPEAEMGLAMANDLFGALGPNGALPESRRAELAMLVASLEAGLA